MTFFLNILTYAFCMDFLYSCGLRGSVGVLTETTP